jgi:hypothetical protein
MRAEFSRSSLSSISTALFLACGSLVLLPTNSVSAKPSFVVRPPPSWVQTGSPEITRKNGSGSATGRSTVLLDETQIRVSEKAVERYYHYARSIETTAVLEDLSQLKFYFEPNYQRCGRLWAAAGSRDQGLRFE